MNHRTSHATCGAILLLAITLSSSAFGADPTAEALYQEGRRAAQAKDWPSACRKFGESHAREPAPGTLLNLADCEENLGKLVAARAHFAEAAGLFRSGDDRADFAKQRMLALDARVARLTLRLAVTAPPDAVVEADGTTLSPSQLGAALLVDPGTHTVIVRALGHSPAQRTLLVAEARSYEIELAAGPEISLASAPATPSTPMRVQPTTARPSGWPSRPLRTGGFISFGVGAAALGLGTVAGLITLGAKNTVDHECGARGCSDKGLDAQARGKDWSTVSGVGFVVGAAGVAAGVGLVLLSFKNSSVQVQPTAGAASLHWRGSF